MVRSLSILFGILTPVILRGDDGEAAAVRTDRGKSHSSHRDLMVSCLSAGEVFARGVGFECGSHEPPKYRQWSRKQFHVASLRRQATTGA